MAMKIQKSQDPNMAMKVQCIGRDTLFGTFRMQNL